MVLLAIEPPAAFNLPVGVVDFTVSMLRASEPFSNIFLAIGVGVCAFTLLFAIDICALVFSAIFPNCNSISVEFVLLPSPTILHGGTYVVALAIELAILPQPIITATVFVYNMSVTLFDIVFKTACVFVFLSQGYLSSEAVL